MHRIGERLLFVASCSALVTGALAQTVPDKQPAPRVEESLLLPVHLARQEATLPYYEVNALDVPLTPEQPFTLNVTYGDETFTLDLQRKSIRAASFEVLEYVGPGRFISRDPGTIRTFLGTVREDKGAVVAGSILRTGLQAEIRLSDGRALEIEPSYTAFAAGDRSTYLVYDHGNLSHDDSAACGVEGVDDHSHDGPPQEGIPNGCGGDFCRAELALDLDNSYYLFWQGDFSLTQSAGEMTAMVANVQYTRDVSITHAITNVTIRSGGDPAGYAAATGTCDYLSAIRAEWNANMGGVQRDLTHLLSNRFAGGCAFVGVVCNLPFAYGYNGPPNFADNGLACIANVLAHEMGHNWNAGHCTCTSPDYTMNPFFRPCPLRFNPVGTIPDIAAFRDSLGCLEPTAVNDDFADAIQLVNGQSEFGSTAIATNDGTASCAASATTPDVWFFFKAAADGTLEATTCSANTNYDTALSIHDRFAAEIVCNDDSACPSSNLQSRVSTAVTAGETYWIRVAGFNGNVGSYEISVTGPASPTPLNDDIADAIEIGAGVYFGTTATATNDGNTTVSCGAASANNDVWYRYTAGNSGTFTASTCQDNVSSPLYDTALSLHDVNGAELVCNDDYCGLQSRVEFDVTAGTTYFLRVSGFNTGVGGYRLAVSCPDVRNDVCNFPRAITDGTIVVNMQAAYLNDVDAGCGPFSDEPDLFYSYTNTAGCAGTLTVQTCGSHDLCGVDSGVDTVVSAYTSCGGAELACNDDSSTDCTQAGFIRDSFIQFPIGAAQTVLIRLSRFTPIRGKKNVFMTTSFAPDPPANDLCANAQNVGQGVFFGTLKGATNDGEASCGAAGTADDVWYRYTAPFTGTLTVTTCGTHDMGGQDTGNDSVLSIHNDFCPGNIANQLACNDDFFGFCGAADQGLQRDSAIQLAVNGGQTVLIRVSSFANSADGPFRLNIDIDFATNYCSASLNSTGAGGVISASGNNQAMPLNLTLQAQPVPNTTGLFYFGPNQLAAEPDFGEGVRCVGGQTRRVFPLTGGVGNVATSVLNGGAGYASSIVAGASLNFQYWFRETMNAGDLDGDGMVEPFNTSDALNIIFQ